MVNSIIPRAKWRDGTIMGIERFAPRLAAGGPLIRDRLAFEFGGRLDYDAVPGRTNLSPRAGAVISLLPQSRGVLRGGAGLFYEQTPLNVAAFETYESQTVTRFDAGGLTPVGPPVTGQHQTHPGFSDCQDRPRLR